ncbi:uncharacterized protein MAM_07345 [Metarhizium album ARSEF 1941]|uniref:Uncharacterized protein n=1 Tax=Metarhizium album (strain ARSEF 1941) TaxID=1081103 RepID=A0A0B2WM85_METAS|nr:uncharacterized protein MAM_07345 [Metarhizium album ARSEF 1941]KHN94749.1 hypothetical protein MAM_07345 [Metarhizium album ARSEF 1941]
MKTALVVGALAAYAAAHTYPNCEHDNCYRALIKDGLQDKARNFCSGWLAGTTTLDSAIPTDFNNCNNVKAASSACSCVTYNPSQTAGPSITSTPALISEEPSTTTPTTTESEQPPTTIPTTQAPATTTPATSHATTKWTTSTVCTTKTYTITSCPTEVTKCPAGHTTVITETIPIYTTVCPVTETHGPLPPPPRPAGNQTSALYTTQIYTISSCPSSVPDCPKVVTTVYPTGTTIIKSLTSVPVDSTQPAQPTQPSIQPIHGTGVPPPAPRPQTTQPSPPIVTAAAGQLVGSLELVAAAAGVAALLL